MQVSMKEIVQFRKSDFNFITIWINKIKRI
jgi:hypothetical protein